MLGFPGYSTPPSSPARRRLLAACVLAAALPARAASVTVRVGQSLPMTGPLFFHALRFGL